MSATLRIVDGEGFAWQVCEIRCTPADVTGASSGAGWLYFLSRRDTLRLSHYPSDWWTRSADELEALRRRAQVPRAAIPSFRGRRATTDVTSDAR